MLSVPLILLVLAILAAVFGTMVAGPVGLLAGLVLLIAFAWSMFKDKDAPRGK